MNPVRTFDQITQEILNKNDFETITVGILIADERVIIRTKLEKPSKIKGLALI